jgi:coiled-coil and C2 domain-containing protein 1
VERYKQYQEVSQKAKASGNTAEQKKNAIMAAKFAKVIKAFAAGNPIDLSQMPPPPPGYRSSYNVDLKELSAAVMQMTAQSQPAPEKPNTSQDTPTTQSPPNPGEDNEGDVPTSDPSIPIPKSPQEALEQRLEKYKSGVESATKEGNSGKARRMGRIVKQYEDALKMLRAGKVVDYAELPTPPGYPPIPVGVVGKPQPPPHMSAHAPSGPVREEVVNSSVQRSAVVEEEEQEEKIVDPGVPQPKTPMEALQQRHAKYKSGQDAAMAEGSSSKARRMGRIVKQYEDAMKALKSGKSVDFEELPTPPGFPPIPVGGAKSVAPSQSVSPRPTPSPNTSGPSPPRQAGRNSQQLALLQKRQAEYRAAAIKHRDAGDREEALRLLKYIKDLDAHIDLAQKGLPIDETAIPPPLGGGSDNTPTKPLPPHQKVKASEGDSDTFDLIETQIQKQIDFCEENAGIYEKAGNRPGASRLRNMADECKQELLAIKGIEGQGLAPPRFTMETRTVSLLNSFPHLSSSECEVEIIRLLDAPKDHTVYVEIEFPYPSDDNPKEQTPKAKDEVNPELKSVHVFPIERKQKRSLARAFGRGMKMNLWNHKALWKDNMIGTAVLKPEELETKAEVRSTVSFYDGRKELTPKVEVAVRLREPLSGADVEEKQVQWVVFMEQIVKKSKVVMPKAKAPAEKVADAKSGTALSGPVKLEETFSLAALKVEYQIAQKNPQLQDQIKKKMQVIQQKLQSDRSFGPNYKKGVEVSISKEARLYQQYAKAGKQREAKILQERVKAMQLEFKKL